MEKKEIAEILEEIAILLELKGENPFRVRAYRNGARAILNIEEDLFDVIEQGKLTDYQGIGDHLAEKITTLAIKGKLPYYDNLKKKVPQGLLDLIQIHGLGPKRVKTLYKKLKIRTISDLKNAIKEEKIRKLRGFGAKTEENIAKSLEHHESYQKRHLWWNAMQIAIPILQGLKELKGVKKAEICGSIRRGVETIGDLDFLVSAKDPLPIMKWFTSMKEVTRVLSNGETKSSVKLEGGIQADIRIVPDSQFPYALVYFTGSKEHNIKLRERSLKKGWSLSEYGFEPVKKSKIPAIKSEEGVYEALKLCYIPPELREDLGEIKAADQNKIPKLIELKDIRGTFHNHTTASDGRNTLKEMISAAEDLGWEYIGITDHSKSSFQANGLSEERLLEQIETIKKLNASKKFKIKIFSGLECDILPNGSLDFPNKILKQLDYVIVSVHNALQQDEKTMTKRIIKAIENPYSTMLGHLTGRLLLKREPYKVNISKVIDACIANHKIIELNSNPLRLDMDWRFWHGAIVKGLRCCINIDAHSIDHYQFLQAGIKIARKGWLEKKDVINTFSLKEIEKFFKKMRP